MHGSGPPDPLTQLSASFVADVGDQKGEASDFFKLSVGTAPDWERQL
jgi:hypothetical protein